MSQQDYRFILEQCVEKLIETADAQKISGDYDEGKAMAYYEMLSSLWTQARIAGIDPVDIGFGTFEPDELLKKKAA